MLEHGHNHLLVIASFAIALMSGFTGLSLTRGASGLPEVRRKLAITMSAIALGGGIWSMHFVAMLGMRLNVPFYYDALTTMISALAAILLTGIALLLVHFGERTSKRIILAGIVVGVGILVMHYLGMSGIQGVEPVYSPAGLVFAFISSLLLCTASFLICYGKRNARNIVYGTIGFGISVFAVHFVAMAGTHFEPIDGEDFTHLLLSNDALAFGVTLTSFAIAGAFLLMGVTFHTATPSKSEFTADNSSAQKAAPDTLNVDEKQPQTVGKIPFEKDGRIQFVPESQVAAVRAEGHYTFLYHQLGRLFCPWSISEIEERITDQNFMRCHRSYFINVSHVTGFERKKDNGVCFFNGDTPLDKAPVSRSYLKAVRAKLRI